MRNTAKEAGESRVPKPIFRRVFVLAIREYLRPGFRPSDKNHDRFIAETLARLTAQGVIDEKATGDVAQDLS